MALTAQKISQLPAFQNIGSLVPAGSFDIIAKSPFLVAELQNYSNEISNGTRSPIGFLPDTRNQNGMVEPGGRSPFSA
jgi:hypothetical protein